MSWTDERVEKLKELWAEGQTASQIAKALGGVSRNAVIGKVHRLGLSNRTAAAKPAAADEPEPDATPKADSIPEQEPPVSEDSRPITEPEEEIEQTVAAEDDVNPLAALAAEVERSARKLSLLELNERTCKWPIGDPSTDDFYFCGLPCEPEKPYCKAHVAVAYQPMSSRRDRDKSRGGPGRAASA